MTQEEILTELESVASEMGIRLRYEKGDFDGGYCILREEKIIVVNKKIHPARKTSVLALALNELGIENVFMKPAIRMFIEDEVVKAR